MAALSKRERVDAALAGQPVDRAPVSAWRHFIPEELSGAALAEATVAHVQTFDWDWIKLNPRATYYAEAWGNRYDFDHYDGVLPRLVDGPVRAAPDLGRVVPVEPTAGVFADHLDAVRRVRRAVGDVHLLQTIFSPLSVLAFLTASPGDQTVSVGSDADMGHLRALIHTDPAAVHAALDAITTTLAGYAAACLEAGASGIFFAIVRLARAGVLSEAEYATFGRPYDLRVLEAAREASFNLLHICGPRVYFDQVLDYPVHALNWAAVGQHNPDLAAARARTNLALVGGINETGALLHGTPAEVMAEAAAALAAGGTTKFLLAPGCGMAMHTPVANLMALRQAVDRA
ncbi:uroporphyrinogen decarboxylase family protein [Chloroflexus sp.]|uniref:uroporphyrinogen decarboxylase family protein n=1 Tax=Chloroflexus sp. TaxID=1904827 RepID=UPI00260CDB6E|nr:uroporphyrinogen decarboxylase family protein [uncultured Chloroflexus sp.]